MKARTRLVTATSALIIGLTMFGTATPAMAVSSNISGEVNCNGYNVYYNTTRYISANSTRIQYTLTNSTNGGGGGYQYMRIGALQVSGNVYLGQKTVSIYSPSAVLSGYYAQNTAFKLYASMPASVGVCDNTFAGILYY